MNEILSRRASEPSPDRAPTSLELDITKPHSARLYDYYLGGKDNYPADRAAAEEVLKVFPGVQTMARQNREFMARAVHFLAAEQSISQFLDIGTGLPTSPNVHQVAQDVIPTARVVYADNDPLVLTHARALLTSRTPQGRTAYLDADLADPAAILSSAQLRETLDLTQPIAVSLIAILHFFPDDRDPYAIVRTLVEALAPGSYLVLSHATADLDTAVGAAVDVYRSQGIVSQARSREQVSRFFDGLELVDPGLTLVHRWRPAPNALELSDAEVSMYGAVARVP